MAKIVEISVEKFKILIKNYIMVRRQNRELRKINEFLNNQINDYNKKFGGQKNDKNRT